MVVNRDLACVQLKLISKSHGEAIAVSRTKAREREREKESQGAAVLVSFGQAS